MDKSYKNYEKYQDNKRRFKTNQIAFPIAVLIIIAILSEFWWLIPLGIVGVIVAILVAKFDEKKQQQNIQQTKTVQRTKVEVDKMAKSKETTEAGYINKNNQLNHGRSEKEGNDHNQYFYNMECLLCGHTYYANGSDIWQRKCPKCQGGK